jgi:hypothetical protein
VVDITRCERCGKVIPATDKGCPYCEVPDQGLREKPYLPLAIRLLLVLFVANASVTMVLAVATLLRNFGGSLADSLITVLASMRFLVSAVTVLGFVMKEPWGRRVPLIFVAFEAITGIAVATGVLPADRWAGGMLAPLWNVLFLFLFLREDVQVRFDPSILDRRAVESLVSQIESAERPSPRRPRR